MNFTEIQDRYDAELKEYEALLHLKRSVKMTRINRINAATRLLQTEDFLQGFMLNKYINKEYTYGRS